MKRLLAVFVLGLTLGMWSDAALVELENSNWWRVFSPSTIEFNHDVIEDALNPAGVDAGEEERPAPTWLYEKTPAHKLA